MVVGNGMMAQAFNKYHNDDKVIIFASGVSNSKEDRESEFNREFELLKKTIIPDNTTPLLIYFSTCSINDVSLKDNRYIKHKLMMEEWIKNMYPNYLIFRVPNVIGPTQNKNTLVENFIQKIINGQKIQVQKDAVRYLIDIDDVVRHVKYVIDWINVGLAESNRIINLAYNNKTNVINLIMLLEKILNTKAIIEIIDGGYDYEIEDSLFLGEYYCSKYNEKLLKKYINTCTNIIH